MASNHGSPQKILRRLAAAFKAAREINHIKDSSLKLKLPPVNFCSNSVVEPHRHQTRQANFVILCYCFIIDDNNNSNHYHHILSSSFLLHIISIVIFVQTYFVQESEMKAEHDNLSKRFASRESREDSDKRQSSRTDEGFHSHGGTPKWMVCVRENPIKRGDLWVPPFMETPIYNLYSIYDTVYYNVCPTQRRIPLVLTRLQTHLFLTGEVVCITPSRPSQWTRWIQVTRKMWSRSPTSDGGCRPGHVCLRERKLHLVHVAQGNIELTMLLHAIACYCKFWKPSNTSICAIKISVQLGALQHLWSFELKHCRNMNGHPEYRSMASPKSVVPSLAIRFFPISLGFFVLAEFSSMTKQDTSKEKEGAHFSPANLGRVRGPWQEAQMVLVNKDRDLKDGQMMSPMDFVVFLKLFGC